MSDLDSVEKILNSKIIEKFYDDFCAGTLRATSKLVAHLIKTFGIPFQYSAAYSDRLQRRLWDSVNKVSEENRIEPPPSISVPIMQQLSYIEDGNILIDLFQNLLARAIDKTRNSEAHPAFIAIINQLSSDEAMLLDELKSNAIEYVSVGKYDNDDNYVYDLKIESNNFNTEKLAFGSHFLMYLNHLHKLDLIVIHLISKPIYVNYVDYHSMEQEETKEQEGVREIRCIELSEFGELFVRACFAGSVSATDLDPLKIS